MLKQKLLNVKNIILLAIFTMFVFGNIVMAEPISELPITVTQPNGEELSLFVSGDEYFNYYHDVDGNIIIQDYDTGYYTYATIENNIIVASDFEVTNNIQTMSSYGLTSTVFNTITLEDVPIEYIQNKYENSPLNETMANTRSLVNDRETHPFLNETINNIVIFIDFSDVQFSPSLDANYFEGILNTNDNSLKKWFEVASYGKTSVVSHLYPMPNGTILGAYRDDYPRSTYQVHHQDSNGNDVYMLNGKIIERKKLEQDMLERAVNAVKSQISEEMNIDVDEDGCVDSVTFIIAGGTGAWNTLLWSHKWSMSRNLYINEKKVSTYTFIMESRLKPNTAYDSVLQHEMFHLYGAPDLYRYKSNYGKVVGLWDNMDDSKGQMTSIYMKYKYGNWIDKIPEIKDDTKTYTINKNTLSTNNGYVLRSPYSTNEFFVVEYRKKEGCFEDAIPRSGIVIYRINSYCRGNASYNGTTILDEVFVANTPDANNTCYPYAGNEVNLYLQDGTDAGIRLNNFVLSDDTASFGVTFSYDKLLNYFMDKRIVNVICTTLNKSIEEITDEDLLTITSLSLSSVGNYDLSVDLTGLEHLSNLQTLILNDCKLNDITPISQLTSLTHLELVNNEIEDFSPLENLTLLTKLKIRGNITRDYSATTEYYDTLTEKDFSLNNQNDIVFNVQNYSNQHNIGNVRIICSGTVPDKIHIVIEKYSADGTLLLKSKRENVSLASNAPSLYISSDFNCQDGSYVVISAYERRKFTKLISKCIVKPITFDFIDFN